eukprot:TRINITY_DN5597_c0_g1_i1.p1 TRINITY_DN5597_c0_g1~~TRINITY_DN5597_c0_g1_i1.p1  ORF type:complete len:544 (+),score=130.28 TRINITY_DN5597_c0_g1_i1:50-1681(+)
MAQKPGTKNDGKGKHNTYIVDTEMGPYKSIKEALDVAEPGAVIKVAPGLYNENIVIRKNNIRLEPKDRSGDFILVVEKRPAILIEIGKEEKCFLVGIKISHYGNSEEIGRFDEMDEKNPFAKMLNMQNQSNFEKVTPDNELIMRFPTDPNINCLIMVNSGKVIMEDMILSFNFLPRVFNGIIPAMIVNDGCEASLKKCEIKGNKNYSTIGIILKNCDAKITECKIHNCRLGGILMLLTKNNQVNISSSKILFNDMLGIQCLGAEAAPAIESCKIENNNGPGISVGISNQATIQKNEIRLNKYGIEVLSADPLIISNKIDKNYADGIVTRVYEELRCEPQIFNNEISGNKENGIHVMGAGNFSRIDANVFIGYNKKAGVRVCLRGHAILLKNNIGKNLTQGVLVVETGTAHIERNKVFENIKANIAIGGLSSVNNNIIENEISDGRCEGIFAIECGRAYILRNNITGNHDGIVMVTAIPVVMTNKIHKNKSNGVFMLKDSRPILKGNEIVENEGMGVYIRDKSCGEIERNLVTNASLSLVLTST